MFFSTILLIKYFGIKINTNWITYGFYQLKDYSTKSSKCHNNSQKTYVTQVIELVLIITLSLLHPVKKMKKKTK